MCMLILLHIQCMYILRVYTLKSKAYCMYIMSQFKVMKKKSKVNKTYIPWRLKKQWKFKLSICISTQNIGKSSATLQNKINH